MTREQAVKAIEIGIALVHELKEKGYNIIAQIKADIIDGKNIYSGICVFCGDRELGGE